jgi:hypothetical protein
MKTWPFTVLLATNSLLAGICFADDAKTQPLATKIPTEERAFVDAINQYDKAKIVTQFGEPAKNDDIRIKGTNKIAASIWQYHNINTAADGSYYPTTELDFIDDKVVQVVFLNNDGSDREESGKSYEIPQPEPNM